MKKNFLPIFFVGNMVFSMFFSSCVTEGKTPVIADLLSFEKAIENAVIEINAKADGKKEIAIANIESPLIGISDFLTVELTKHLLKDNRFIVLERGSALETVNAEHEFQISGLVSDESAVGVGHYLKAKLVINGSFACYNGFFQLKLRVIDVDSSQLLSLYTTKIQPDDPFIVSVIPESMKPQIVTENVLQYLNRGEELVREGKYKEAIRELDQAIALKKDLPDAYFYRAISYSII